jgi:hypothetical protein
MQTVTQVDWREIFDTDTSPPSIDLWYGNQQAFGRHGHPQRWVNILGHVSSPNRKIRGLTYTLNRESQPHPIHIGSDGRRLMAAGDFNIELDVARLQAGKNVVTITAENTAGRQTTCTLAFDYHCSSAPPLPDTIDWSTVERVQDIAQVVDGYWILADGGLRIHPDYVGYDRAVAVGDRTWADYEVTVPLVVRAVDEACFGSKTSVCPGLGLILRWNGHTQTPIAFPHLHTGWLPCSTFWLKWERERPPQLQISENQGSLHRDASTVSVPKVVTLGETYWLKGQMQTFPGGSSYKLKFWQDGTPEPLDWDVLHQGNEWSKGAGSLLLVAHHVDVTFGNLSVRPL